MASIVEAVFGDVASTPRPITVLVVHEKTTFHSAVLRLRLLSRLQQWVIRLAEWTVLLAASFGDGEI